MMKTHMNIPVFIPHLGCGHSCAFCSQRSVTNVMAAPSPESVAFSIKEALRTKGDKKAEIAFFGGSFTGIPRKDQEAYLLAAKPFLLSGEAEGIRLSTRPDYIDEETVSFLKAHGVKTVELGAQSMCDDVLEKSRRGHTAADTRRAARLIIEGGLTLGLQMMTGLPLSTPEKEAETAREFVRLGAKEARIYPLAVFYDTPLYAEMLSGRFVPPTAEESVDRVADALAILEEGGIKVLRIGLMETQTLSSCIAGGAYHPAMGEMARARLWRNRLEKALSGLWGDVTVFCEEKLISSVLGHKRDNFRFLSEKYPVRLSLAHTEKGVYLLQNEIRKEILI